MVILVTGGAGYIGSVVAEQLLAQGHEVIIYDRVKANEPRAKIVQGQLADKTKLEAVFQKWDIDLVMHLAGFPAIVDESVTYQTYLDNNLYSGIILLQSMYKNRITEMVYSSSCAVYGDPGKLPITEDEPIRPINKYGVSKAAFEESLRGFCENYGMNAMALRYFNAAGATGSNGENHDPETHLIPKVIRAAYLGEQFFRYGDDSYVRDYVHVSDIAHAHILAMDRLKCGSSKGYSAFNIGSGVGYKVSDVMKMVEIKVGKQINLVQGEPRPNDPKALVASYEKARAVMGWVPTINIDKTIDTAYAHFLKMYRPVLGVAA